MNAHSQHVPARIPSLDILRGLALVLAMLQHAFLVSDKQSIPSFAQWILWMVTNLAPIAFVAVSGATCSFHVKSKNSWTSAYRAIALRALFLLSVGHILVNLSCYPYAAEQHLLSDDAKSSILASIVLGFPITDTIALCLLIAPPLQAKLTPPQRIVLVAILLLLPIVAPLYWTSGSEQYAALREFLLGIPGDFRASGEPKVFWWPILPWLGVFLTGSFLTDILSNNGHSTLETGEASIRLAKIAILLLVLSAILTIAYRMLKFAYLQEWGAEWFHLMYPNRLTTLFPAYIASLALLTSGIAYILHVRRIVHRSLWFLSVLGRVSLFAYAMQFVVVESLPAVLGLVGRLKMLQDALLFFTALIVVTSASYLFGRLRGRIAADDYRRYRRFLTLGSDRMVVS